MSPALRSELLKLRTTRTTVGTLAAMAGVVLLAMALHSLGLPKDKLVSTADQRKVFLDVGSNMGMAFAALLGAMAVTIEVRYGTIRPTLLATPRRSRVVVSKMWTALGVGLLCGSIAAGVATSAGTLFLRVRGLHVDVSGGQYFELVVGGALAGALWATIGLGVGAIVRSQVPAVVGLFVWILFVENVLIAGVPSVGKYSPGALGRALAGQQVDAVASWPAALLALVTVAGAAVCAALAATTTRDFT